MAYIKKLKKIIKYMLKFKIFTEKLDNFLLLLKDKSNTVIIYEYKNLNRGYIDLKNEVFENAFW